MTGIGPLLGRAAPAGASGPHVYTARGLDIIADKASPWPSSTQTVRAGRVLTDISVTMRDVLTYAVVDDFGGWTTGTIEVTVTATTPTAEARAVTAPKGTGTAITLTGVDPNGRPTTCAVDVTSAQAKVTLTGTGCTRTITPKAGTSGTDTFTYAIRNDTGQVSARASVTVTIPNRAPVADAASASGEPGERVSITFGGHDILGRPPPGR